MTLLEVITKASPNHEPPGSQLDHPIILNPDNIFLNLKPELDNLNPASLVTPVSGWKISEVDSELIDLGKKFHAKLKRKLKDTNNFNKEEFIGILNPFLQKISERVGVSIEVNTSDNGYSQGLIEKTGFLMGRDVACLVLEACLNLKIWELVETLIVNMLVDHSSFSNLVMRLASEKRSDLLCFCVKYAPDLGSSELLCILKYFLCPHKDAYGSMVSVRKEWESQALLAIEKASDENLSKKKLHLAKEASILLMVAHDGFSVSELCLHYLLASSTIDEVILSSSISKLNGKEMMSLIRYLGKWLKKFERFPQAGPCPEASYMLGLKACDWIPKLEVIVQCLGLVLDENFSSLVLHPEFREELRSIEGVVSILTLEARHCCALANVVKNLGIDGEGMQN
ncbi:putative F6A14.6 protein [Melia azedarach]|uniref:F6A14.6 protein n=2 Tax=Melia azedarach TaxID=155640 RepID=A0ACC1XMK5_MELAZ|nr:putative F6A14.6 protein [Melia azedarach]KAJ4712158.1 putative F6A14.6 protein [Melia azedarach]